MTIAARINMLFIAVAVVMGAVTAGMVAVREYHIARRQVVDASQALVLSRPDLQLAIYRRDQAALEGVLDELLALPAVVTASALDGLGEVLARAHGEGEPDHRLPSFARLRGDASAVDTALVALDSRGEKTGTGLWSALGGSGLPMHLTIPVFTSVNPSQRGLQPVDFLLAQAEEGTKGSLRVIGYVQVGIGRAQLLQGIEPAVHRVLFGALLLIALCAVILVTMTRRFTADISRLVALADDVAAGKPQQPVELSASSEFRELAMVLNSVIGGFTSFRREADVGQRLLNMKVDERTSQLSERDEALNRAAEEISETRSRLQRLSNYDSLTSLPNRRLFTEQLNLLLGLNQRSGQHLALLFLDMDNFKRINESLGQSAGDLTLRGVAQRLSACVRDSDAIGHYVDSEQGIDVARLGGDEFTVVLNQLEDIDAAALVAQRLLDALREPIVVEGHEVVVTPSIGIAVAPRDGNEVEPLLKAAGIAMHHAKASVRDQFLYYDDDMDATGVGRLKLESDLRRAVQRDELLLHYQPLVNTHTGSVAGAEALLRWQHPEHGLLPPAQFIGLAEEIGVIGELGDWVLSRSCQQLRESDEQGLELPRVTINVSALQFGPAYVEQVTAALDQFGLESSRLELGLTERILTDSDPAVARSIGDLRELGVRLSIDDFGASYAPLGYLGHHLLDELRIDRSFVAECGRDADGDGLVRAIIAMAGSLGLDTVAEGVESEAQYRFLADSGVQVMQGYLFSKPVPFEELRPMLAPWHFVAQLQKL